MGQRGPLRQPDSRRGLIETGGKTADPIQEEIICPDWVKGKARREFSRLVEQNRAAGVAIRLVDADQYAELADAIVARQEEKDPRIKISWSRQISELRSQLNIGPRNRRRVGIRDEKEKPKLSRQMEFINRARGA